MIFEKDSFPLPLSPVIRTDISVGATCIATRTELFSSGAFPMIPNLWLIFWISTSVIAIIQLLYLSVLRRYNPRPVHERTDPFSDRSWEKQSLCWQCSGLVN